MVSRAVWVWPTVDICNLYLEPLFWLCVHLVLDQAAYLNVCGLMVISCEVEFLYAVLLFLIPAGFYLCAVRLPIGFLFRK